MSWLQADRPRSEAAQLVSGMIGASLVGLGYAIVVGEQHGMIPVDPFSFDRPSMPLGVVLAPIIW